MSPRFYFIIELNSFCKEGNGNKGSKESDYFMKGATLFKK